MKESEEEKYSALLKAKNIELENQKRENEQLISSVEGQIEERTNELKSLNDELFKYNNELRQFSFTVSHNLRSPVARILGIIDLLKRESTAEEKEKLLTLLNQSANDLDELIRDLNKIIDIREEVYRIREKIYFDEEVEKVREQLFVSWQPSFQLTTNFDACPYLYSVKAIINSILFNFLSNAIKYRSPERNLHIDITAKADDQNCILRIQDNGLGMNLPETRKDMFKMYKRFHTHIDGKGLGLYLVKIQADTIKATLDVQSELNRGTTFEIRIPHIRSVENQIFFDTDFAQLSFDANINSTVVLWKRNVESEEYRTVFQKVVQTLTNYNSPSWIADLRNQGTVGEADQKWFIKEVLEAASRIGLKRIGTMGFSDPVRTAYYDRMKTICSDLNIVIRDFETLEDAKSWLASHMTK